MVSIVVIRGNGDIEGEDIVDPLITSEAVAIQRGRKEIDANAKVQKVSLGAVYRQSVRTGQMVQVMDALHSRTWRGKVVSLDISVEGPQVTTSMEIERVWPA